LFDVHGVGVMASIESNEASPMESRRGQSGE